MHFALHGDWLSDPVFLARRRLIARSCKKQESVSLVPPIRRAHTYGPQRTMRTSAELSLAT